jgi:hypothetical protein
MWGAGRDGGGNHPLSSQRVSPEEGAYNHSSAGEIVQVMLLSFCTSSSTYIIILHARALRAPIFSAH